MDAKSRSALSFSPRLFESLTKRSSSSLPSSPKSSPPATPRSSPPLSPSRLFWRKQGSPRPLLSPRLRRGRSSSVDLRAAAPQVGGWDRALEQGLSEQRKGALLEYLQHAERAPGGASFYGDGAPRGRNLLEFYLQTLFQTPDRELMEAFCACYRVWASPMQLATVLAACHRGSTSPSLKQTIEAFFFQWLNHDFEAMRDPPVHKQLLTFFQGVDEEKRGSLAQQFRALSQLAGVATSGSVQMYPQMAPSEPRSRVVVDSDTFDFDPAVIGKELTKLMNCLFVAVERRELVSYLRFWGGASSSGLTQDSQEARLRSCSNLLSFLQYSKALERWVLSSVACAPTKPIAMGYWITVAEACLRLRNYHGARCISDALQLVTDSRHFLSSRWPHGFPLATISAWRNLMQALAAHPWRLSRYLDTCYSADATASPPPLPDVLYLLRNFHEYPIRYLHKCLIAVQLIQGRLREFSHAPDPQVLDFLLDLPVRTLYFTHVAAVSTSKMSDPESMFASSSDDSCSSDGSDDGEGLYLNSAFGPLSSDQAVVHQFPEYRAAAALDASLFKAGSVGEHLMERHVRQERHPDDDVHFMIHRGRVRVVWVRKGVPTVVRLLIGATALGFHRELVDQLLVSYASLFRNPVNLLDALLRSYPKGGGSFFSHLDLRKVSDVHTSRALCKRVLFVLRRWLKLSSPGELAGNLQFMRRWKAFFEDVRSHLNVTYSQQEFVFASSLDWALSQSAQLANAPALKQLSVSWYEEVLPSSKNAPTVAELLTSTSRALYLRLWPSDLLGSDSVRLKRCVERFNAVSMWAAAAVVTPDSAKMRAKYMVALIRIADMCRELGNLQDSYAIVSGLCTQSVSRLKQTAAIVEKNSLARRFELLQQLFSPMRGYFELRYYQERMCAHITVPFLGLASKDLYGLQENNSSFVTPESFMPEALPQVVLKPLHGSVCSSLAEEAAGPEKKDEEEVAAVEAEEEQDEEDLLSDVEYEVPDESSEASSSFIDIDPGNEHVKPAMKKSLSQAASSALGELRSFGGGGAKLGKTFALPSNLALMFTKLTPRSAAGADEDGEEGDDSSTIDSLSEEGAAFLESFKIRSAVELTETRRMRRMRARQAVKELQRTMVKEKGMLVAGEAQLAAEVAAERAELASIGVPPPAPDTFKGRTLEDMSDVEALNWDKLRMVTECVHATLRFQTNACGALPAGSGAVDPITCLHLPDEEALHRLSVKREGRKVSSQNPLFGVSMEMDNPYGSSEEDGAQEEDAKEERVVAPSPVASPQKPKSKLNRVLSKRFQKKEEAPASPKKRRGSFLRKK